MRELEATAHAGTNEKEHEAERSDVETKKREWRREREIGSQTKNNTEEMEEAE